MKDLPDDLNELPVPEHRSGFWTDLAADLAMPDRTATRRGVRSAGALSRRRIAMAAALATIAAFSFLPGILTGEERVTGGQRDLTPRSTLSPVATTAPTSVVDTTTPQPESAPWEPQLSQAEVPAVFSQVWNKAENNGWCSALAPATPTPLAKPREAYFGGGWAVAYDRSEGPGRTSDGIYCPDCGRSAYGIAGGGMAPDEALIRSRGDVRENADGSLVSYHKEGFDPTSKLTLADIALPAEGCVYQAWSMLGRDHLEGFVAQLRRVEGLQASPMVRRSAADTKEIDGGPPPWNSPAISQPNLLAVAFDRSLDGGTTPVIGFSDTGSELGGATVRAASIGNWGVAWDNPSGPGHDSGNYPCADCGRGVIGIGSMGTYEQGTIVWTGPPLAEIRWDDGSLAVITWRIGDLWLPENKVRYPDPTTGEMVPDGVQATVYIPDAGTYQVWSHLGYDHLVSLLEAMRFVNR